MMRLATWAMVGGVHSPDVAGLVGLFAAVTLEMVTKAPVQVVAEGLVLAGVARRAIIP
jgi:hypothetical protein